MIISRTPFRVSFFGGGTDYPAWFNKHGGAVLATTINKYCYLTCRCLPPFFEHRYRVICSEMQNAGSVDEIEHPVVRAVLHALGVSCGVEIHHDSDLPSSSGMGSSSAFTVGLLHSLYALMGRMVSARQLANESIHIEQDHLKETVGCQDQILAAYGGFNRIDFVGTGAFRIRPVTLRPARIEQLERHLMLFYTGMRRTASEVAKSYVDKIEDKAPQLRAMQDMVKEGIGILDGRRDIELFGRLLHRAWKEKRSLSDVVTNCRLDEYYQRAIDAGALGGKITGAGAGGFLLIFVPPYGREKVRGALHDLIQVPFEFEFKGSEIIFFEPEEDYSLSGKDA